LVLPALRIFSTRVLLRTFLRESDVKVTLRLRTFVSTCAGYLWLLRGGYLY